MGGADMREVSGAQGRTYDVEAFEEHCHTITDELELGLVQSVQTGLFDAGAFPAAPLVPRLVRNDEATHDSVLATLEREMRDCDRLDLAVAFIARSGIQVLMRALLGLEARGVPVRLLTSTYLDFNDPDALQRMLAFKNVELRVLEGPLHTKGYLFSRGALRTLVVGSSNLTQSALKTNQEWNLLLNAYDGGSVWRSTVDEFERIWTSPDTRLVTPAWLEWYRSVHHEVPRRAPLRAPALAADAGTSGAGGPIAQTLPDAQALPDAAPTPNKMQRAALENLARLREGGATKALLVSATGTGKTYLAAFDARAARPRRTLFVVHRRQIAERALASFRRVMGEGRTFGIYSGATDERDADCVFATVQLLARHIDEFSPDEFDYVVVDEAHRAGAESYRRILGRLRPRFLLGMTATPDRSDGVNVYDLFDNNIAYRITLRDAQESRMLSPFHYFGISDLTLDGQSIDEHAAFARLTAGARVDHIIRQILRYSVDRTRRGLVFCSRVDEARELSRAFNERGFRTLALDGSTSEAARADAVERLQADRASRPDWLEYLFTVDIFNEGIDIPNVNQVIMLRPTESAIVFVQQLGRGLRKVAGKDYVLVLDFIGNYQQSFLIPVALSGDRSYNKDNLRRFMREGSRLLPGCSTVSFDEVSERHIYRMLDRARLSDVRRIRDEYLSLRHMLGRIPRLRDFCDMGSIDPELIFANKSLGSYHAFLSKYERDDYHVSFTAQQEQMLKFVSQKLAAGKRPHELVLLGELIDRFESALPPATHASTDDVDPNDVTDSHPAGEKSLRLACVDVRDYADDLARISANLPVAAWSVAGVLGQAFLTGSQAKTFSACDFVTFDGDEFSLTDDFAAALSDAEFRRQMREVVDFGLMRNGERYGAAFDHTSLVLYQKYTYEDVCRLLEWDANVSGQNIGGYKYDAKTNTFPVFINYEKGEDVADSIRYQDRFLSPSRLVAISKQPRHLDSPEIVRLRGIAENHMRVFLFVRKNKDDAESKEFYFLGEMRPTGEYEEIVMANTDKPAVEIGYELDTPVPDELFDYLTSGVQ